MKKFALCGLLAAVVMGITGCQTTTESQAKFANGVIARWGLKLPYENMNSGWLEIKQNDKGAYEATLLWRWASPYAVSDVTCDGKTFTLRVREDHPRKEKPEEQRIRVITGKLHGGTQSFEVPIVDGNGKKVADLGTVKAIKLTPPGPKPDLSKAVKGEPIDLLADGLKGWKPMSKDINCWSIKDGVLSNCVPKDEKGRVTKYGANLQTVRTDFFDFNLKTEVRLPKNSNSGIYLRGIYEVQMIDSYGKALDCHNMGALYGRITPLVAAERPAGEWQVVDITLYKRHITVKLNHKTIIDNQPVDGITGGALQPCECVPGPIYLQGDHSDADYRNMILTPLK